MAVNRVSSYLHGLKANKPTISATTVSINNHTDIQAKTRQILTVLDSKDKSAELKSFLEVFMSFSISLFAYGINKNENIISNKQLAQDWDTLTQNYRDLSSSIKCRNLQEYWQNFSSQVSGTILKITA